MNKPIGAIVLAAGFSTRFGSSKLLAPLHEGKTVFQQTLERIAEAFPERFVVTRPELAEQLRKQAPDTAIRSFEHAERGMGATLAFAAAGVGDWSGCLVCLGDMPFVKPSTYLAIAEQLTENAIVIPNFDGEAGNPVAFASSYFSELAKLDGDSGGRSLIQQHSQAVHRLSVDDPGILQDIDTPAELAHYQGS